MVPSKGLEPPHPCEYMDLNHARLPIPPRWQYWTSMQRRPQGRRVSESGRPTLLFYSPVTTCQTLAQSICNSGSDRELSVLHGISQRTLRFKIAMRPSIKAHAKIPNPPTQASQSSRSSRSTPSIPDIPFPPLPHTSETSPHPRPEPSPLHRCGSM